LARPNVSVKDLYKSLPSIRVPIELKQPNYDIIFLYIFAWLAVLEHSRIQTGLIRSLDETVNGAAAMDTTEKQ
jgi:hypothetical protein